MRDFNEKSLYASSLFYNNVFLTSSLPNDQKLTDKASTQERSHAENGIEIATEKEKYTASDNEIKVNIQKKVTVTFDMANTFQSKKTLMVLGIRLLSKRDGYIRRHRLWSYAKNSDNSNHCTRSVRKQSFFRQISSP
jgi:hypothetical protein